MTFQPPKWAHPLPQRDADIKREEEKGKSKKFVYKSFATRKEEGGLVMAEQGFDPESGANYFIIYHTKTGYSYKDIAFVNDAGETVRPIPDPEVRDGFIGLPTTLEDYGTEEELDKCIERFVKLWLDIPSHDRYLAVLNIRRSWIYDRFRTLNYLRALGEPGQGKSRYLDTLGAIHYKPMKTSGALTSAVLFRIIDKWRGTIIIDEADLARGDETADITKIINVGFEAGTPIQRCDPNDPSKIDFFNVFCPKVISTRKPFADQATETRCLTTTMRGTNRKDIPPTLTKEFDREVLSLRNKLLLWRFRNYTTIDPDAALKIPFEGIEPRLRQVSVGFVALFAHKPAEVDRFLNYLRDYQRNLVEERSSTFEGSIVKAVAELFVDKKPITAGSIVSQADLRDKHGQLWTPRSITKWMKILGFGVAAIKRVDGAPQKVYEIDPNFLESRVRSYVSDDALLEKVRNCVTIVTEHMKGYDTVTEQEKKENVTVQGPSHRTVTTVTQLQPHEKTKNSRDACRREVLACLKSSYPRSFKVSEDDFGPFTREVLGFLERSGWIVEVAPSEFVLESTGAEVLDGGSL